MTTNDETTLPLRHGHRIPRIGLGTWPSVDDECSTTVERAISYGYRLLDTAQKYANHTAVGEGIRRSGIPRSELFITSKFNKEHHSFDGVRRAYDQALAELGTDYLDLYLIHWPVPALDKYVDAWKGLVRLLEEGQVKAIGVSNFKTHHLDRIIAETDVAPDVNQIQLSVDIARVEQRAYHRAHGIMSESWSPLGRGGPILTDPIVTSIASRHMKSPAQILLRWQVEEGIVPVPHASNDRHLVENIDIFDFVLSDEDIRILRSLDLGERAARDSDDPSNGH